MENKTVTFNRVRTGEFEVLLNGVVTNWRIVNGSMGVSGRGKNTYCLYHIQTGKTIAVGSLASAKKSMVYTLTRKR